MKKDLDERILKFAVQTIKFLKLIPCSKENDVIKYQLSKSVTSIGANFEEAQGAFSREDFKFKISLCYKEIRETFYWFRILKECSIGHVIQSKDLMEECNQLKAIFISIMIKLKR